MMTYAKSIVHTGTNDLRSNANHEEVANSIIDVAVKGK